MVDGLCAIQILQRPFARRGLRSRAGLVAMGGLYASLHGIPLRVYIASGSRI
jgi:hypothetical protein